MWKFVAILFLASACYAQDDSEIVATADGIMFIMQDGQKVGYRLGNGSDVYFTDFPSEWRKYTDTMFSVMKHGFDIGVAAAASAPAPPVAAPTNAASGLPGFEDLSWNEIESRAVGGTVNFWMWNGVGANRWVTQWLAKRMKERFHITVNIGTGVASSNPGTYGAPQAVAKVMEESKSDPTDGGSVDLIWINGANFKNLKPYAYGPFAWKLPSSSNYNWRSPEMVFDFGTPTEGYEMPYNAAQFVFYCNTLQVPSPPKTIPDLVNWIKGNSGRFTYADPTADFLGSAVMKHFFYYYAGEAQGGSYSDFIGDFDEALYRKRSKMVWAKLKEIEPFLADIDNGSGGKTKYPASHDKIRDKFASTDIWLDGAYDPTHASTQILNGVYQNETKSFVMDTGSISNINFVAIPKNAKNKYAALVTTNVIASIEGVFTRTQPELWGPLPAYDANSDYFLNSGWDAAFDYITTHHAAPTVEDLTRTRVPELASTVQQRIESDWKKCVLQKSTSSDCM